MSANRQTMIRSVNENDVKSINELVQFGTNVHQHLDWRQPSEWIGQMPFHVLEWNFQLVAALACPPDPKTSAWIRLFAVNSRISVEDAWKGLWAEVRVFLANQKISLAAIAFQKWFRSILVASNFEQTGEVIHLQRDQGLIQIFTKTNEVSIRNMVLNDLPTVQEVDKTAFEPLWQHSPKLLEIAFKKSSIATVAENKSGIVGYQISTANVSSGHIARLAVLPDWQGRGVGYSLVHHVVNQFDLWGTLRVTVNTQSDNYSSMALYKKVGFRKTNEVYPVYQFNHRK